MTWRRLTALLLLVLALVVLAWLVRAQIAARLAAQYFRQHGIASSVQIGDLGFAGLSGRFALGPADAPDIAADRIALFFDPLSFMPRVVEVRLVHPVMRARIDAAGRVTLGSLQGWLDSLGREQGHSRFVSDDLTISLQGLRALLATPAGNIELDGDVRLVRNAPVAASLALKPAQLVYRGQTVRLRAAHLTYDAAKAHLIAQFSGDLQSTALAVRKIDSSLDATGLHWNSDKGFSLSASQARLQVRAEALSPLAAPMLDLTVRNAALSLANGKLEGRADLAATAGAGLVMPGLRTPDPALTRAITKNLSRLTITLAAHVEQRDGETRFVLTAPSTVTGAGGGALRVSALTLLASPTGLGGAGAAQLQGSGLPNVKLAFQQFTFAKNAFSGDATLSAHFNLGILRGADIAANGALSWQDERLAFAPSACLKGALAAFHPGANLPGVGDLARDIRGAVCSVPGQPLLSIDKQGWRFNGNARGASAFLPLANAQIENAAAELAFHGAGRGFSGRATVASMQASDRTQPLRFQPVEASGTADLQNGIWQGHFAVGLKKYALGDVVFTHTMASGAGTAHLTAPAIPFSVDKLQPDQLSPLLAGLRRAEGSVHFNGDLTWTRRDIKSNGTLSIDSLDFLTPLGRAHAVKSSIALISLLPPATADGQHVTISQVDWTLPLSGLDIRFGFDPAAARISTLRTGVAQGQATLGPLTINLADPGHLKGEAQLSSISLGSLIAASNLGDKLNMSGKISGTIPFTLAPEGFRIVNGHVAADGPGRLSISRSLWTQGEATLNAVQDFAYQALENLAFDQMTADLNSVANGRLQVVFHIKGRSDPPKKQTADIPVTDLINGTAFQEPIPLPSGTPIDLTLDTSLNFDELLKSYAEAWSKILRPVGHPDANAGATR